ncbi:MAG: glycine/sarcosine/betaine reductase selenoprotein B family protein [bacterium]|jgi:D-proline reductase (dithiol) PrdB|nr:selenoprotein B glycine/betaine/sarcosine/D-proline reductase [Gammaproteobacteria bacterium]HIL85092.1 selenoprotein B glycine/betaine/sarcosine/D-proline reductase [Pseudomonadales bacterium]
MVRLVDLPAYEREHLLSKNEPPLGPPVWQSLDKEVSALRVALITTAGLHFRDDPAFEFADSTFRPISNNEDSNNLVMSHSSVNFDKSGFAEDVNLVFPIDRFRELETDSKIGSLAEVHYSFMGAGLNPSAYEATASQVAGLLKQDKVDAVFLTPV